ncbi:MAG: glycosyltransferase family 2 protein [Anaerolineales bacterium]|nr:glycosyltransferase family 2 protein [Anaerolineales bacterium]
MTYPQILAIILNWRQADMTIECVQALQRISYPYLNVLVIDNGSGDDSVSKMEAALTDVTVVALPKNSGFAGGCNWGMRYAVNKGFAWALLLNNDAFAASDMLMQLVEEVTDDIALLSPMIFYEEEPTRIWFAGGRQHPLLLEMRDSGQNKKDDSLWKTRDVDYLVGTCLLVNLPIVMRVGLLDEQYFMYYEDLDWSIRLRLAGFRLRLVSNAHLYHRVSFSSGGEGSPLHRYYLARSSVRFFRRHASEGVPLFIFMFRLASAVKMLGKLVWRRQWATAVAYLQGLHSGLKNKKAED